MYNSEKQNLEFKIAFSETNIRWLLGAVPVDEKLVDFHRKEIEKAQKRLDELK